MKVLITGNAGTGKSSVLRALQSLNYPGFDGDELTEIHKFLDKQTGDIVQEPGPERFERYSTIWEPSAFRALLQEHSDIVIAGSVHNQADFYPLFDTIICLYLPADHLNKRLAARSNNKAGNSAEDRLYLLSINYRVNDNLRKTGAKMISSLEPLEEVVKKVVEAIDAND